MLVGRYQLMFRLGKGGMGEVWAASTNVAELGFQKLIALKVLRTTDDVASNAAVMFLDEAKRSRRAPARGDRARPSTSAAKVTSSSSRWTWCAARR
jgi:serine/threonine protein kinase